VPCGAADAPTAPTAPSHPTVAAPLRSQLLALHRTATLRHNAIGSETLLNLLLRNYLHYNLYDQVGAGSRLLADDCWLLAAG
jgi:hypothetical protein